MTRLHQAWATSFVAILSLCLFASALNAQDEPDFSGLSAPSSYERARANAELEDEGLHEYYRKVLNKETGSSSIVIRALEHVGRQKNADDIPLIIGYIDDLEPSIAATSMQALRAYGRDAIKAIQKLEPDEIDQSAREEVLEQLLKDHVVNCCTRDRQINPFQLSFDGRFDELYSIGEEIDELMFKMVRDSISDFREDIDGNRYYYGYNVQRGPFIYYGNLVFAALGDRHPDRLMRETEELIETDNSSSSYYWSNRHAPATVELAVFFARQGETALVDKFINELESSRRWRGNDQLGIQMQIAAMQVNALDEYDAALDRLTEHLKQAGSAFDSVVAMANYLRARILIHLGEEGAALHSLEEAMEASNSPVVLVLVDSSFAELEDERRYQTVLQYCELAARRLDDSQRPWRDEDDAKED